MTALATVEQKLPFMVNLTVDERKARPKLGDKSRTFIKKAVDVAGQNTSVLPASCDLSKMRNDAQVFEGFFKIQLVINRLQKQVNDTTLEIGTQAYTAARDVYAAAKSRFGRAAMETAANELGQRFTRKSKATAPKADGTAPSETSQSATPQT